MPTLSLVNFNIVCATLGGFISIFGLVSYLLKERFYLSEASISTVAGLIFSPHALNWIRPLEYARNSEEDLETITLYFTRLVLGVQLVLAGVQLPSKYLWMERKSLAILIGPGNHQVFPYTHFAHCKKATIVKMTLLIQRRMQQVCA